MWGPLRFIWYYVFPLFPYQLRRALAPCSCIVFLLCNLFRVSGIANPQIVHSFAELNKSHKKTKFFYISIFPCEAPLISEIFSHIRGVAHFFKPFRVVFFAVNHKCCIVFYMLHFYEFNYLFAYSNTFPSVHY